MARRSLVLAEHSTRQGVELSLEDAQALNAAGARIVTVPRSDGRFDVQTKQVVGTVRTANLDVVIHPKVSIEGFLELLGHAADLARLHGRLDLQRWDELLPSLTRLYAHALAGALRRGALRGYHPHRDELAFCRGRIDVLDLVTRRYGIVPPITCDFEEFSPDIEVNRRLRAAADFLVRSGFGRDRDRGLLRTSLGQLTDVGLRRYRPPLAPLPRDRRVSNAYGPAVDLANLILTCASVELRHGAVASVGFLVNMDDLYERWVSAVLRRALGASGSRWKRHPPKLYLDHDESVKLEPDMVWLPSGRPPLPIDAKYKRSVRLPNPDVYQMAAYCTGLDVSEGVVMSVDVEPYVLRLVDGVRIHVRRLSVEGGPEKRERAVRSEALFLRELMKADISVEAAALSKGAP